jgi:hypothetical protein
MKISKTINVLVLYVNNSFLTKKCTQISTHTKLSEHYLMQETGNYHFIIIIARIITIPSSYSVTDPILNPACYDTG